MGCGIFSQVPKAVEDVGRHTNSRKLTRFCSNSSNGKWYDTDVSDCFAEVAVRPFEDVHDVEVFYSENVENEKNDMGDFNQEYFYPAARKKSDESPSKFSRPPQQNPSKSKDKKKKMKAVAVVPSKRSDRMLI